jgi:hypothetical protein
MWFIILNIFIWYIVYIYIKVETYISLFFVYSGWMPIHIFGAPECKKNIDKISFLVTEYEYLC